MATHDIVIKNLPDDDISRLIQEEFVDDFCEGYILVGDEDTCMPKYYADYAQLIKNFKVQDDDIMVCSYPKSGTTWTQEMVWLISNDLDYEGAKSKVRQRFPFLEACTLFDHENLNKALGEKNPDFINKSFDYVNALKGRRFIKTHLPFSLLPQEIKNGSKSPKMIYIMRNPKDALVSYYNHIKIFHQWRANLESLSKVFLADRTVYGSFWKHVLGYWSQRNRPNLLIITFEDMKKDLPAEVRKVAKFLGKALTDEEVVRLCDHLSFESMKDNIAVNAENILETRRKKKMLVEDRKFMRSGTVGKYKEDMSPEMIAKFDGWIEENTAGTGLKFDA